MTLIHIYLALFTVTFLILAIQIMIKEKYLLEVLQIATLNILYVLAWILIKNLKSLAIKRATRILGRKPMYNNDFIELGLPEDIHPYSVKGLVKILFMKIEGESE